MMKIGRPIFSVSRLDEIINVIDKDISISHIKEYAIASVTMLIDPNS